MWIALFLSLTVIPTSDVGGIVFYEDGEVGRGENDSAATSADENSWAIIFRINKSPDSIGAE